MYIAVTIKRYRAVKEVGEIKMSVGITAYYQAKQICQVKYQLQLYFVLKYCCTFLHVAFILRLSISASYLSPSRSLVLQSSGHWDLGRLLLVVFRSSSIEYCTIGNRRPKSITIAKLLITDKHPMHSDWYFHSKEAMPPLTNQVDNTCMNNPVASTFAAVQPLAAKHLMPVHGIEFQSSEICPKNFIIFDQAGHRSQVLYNPAVAHNHIGPSLNIHGTYIQENFERTGTYNVEREISSSLKEDSDDIDALMSMEEEEQEEYDGEEVSTARTCRYYRSSSPDSCSSYGAKPIKNGSSVQKCSSSGSSSNSERKRQKMKKMVKTLRGIVPGGDQMNTVTVLDEAVRYLKSLKVEVQKLGSGNFKN
ncbi:hypothetical protein SADUNF_Sadunf11G0054500 [Salix dunnii]|uniref:BHLH domain-containing protein n=1 Tax=Salix dunnii TaxID=1413687 RepID=A0A835JNS4_9ROSI|nr:hypothetical protein SADUNF_Sadunf11G0054500 [Salix dunnii]